MTSPDGTLVLDSASTSETSPGSPGMGHDMDDYFHITQTLTVREVATGRVVATRSWGADYDAGSQTGGWLPTAFVFTDDSRAVLARWKDGTEERIALPGR